MNILLLLIVSIITVTQGKIFIKQYCPTSAVKMGTGHISCTVINNDMSQILIGSSNSSSSSRSRIAGNMYRRDIPSAGDNIDRNRSGKIKRTLHYCDTSTQVRRSTALHCAKSMIQEDESMIQGEEMMIQEEDRLSIDTETSAESKKEAIDDEDPIQNRVDDNITEEFGFDDYYVEPINTGQETPINLFHSVVCGSYGTAPEEDHNLVTREKAPIIVLHGLLGSARNFQSWMKLSQQKEKELEMEEMKRDQTSFPLVTRDIICMDLRNHGRTGSHYGALKMDFEVMARDVIHTLNSLGLSEVHLVGHSLGGKVAAVVALLMAQNEKEIDIKHQKIKILSLTMMDVSPVDYSGDPVFTDVFNTLDICTDIDALLPFVGGRSNFDDSTSGVSTSKSSAVGASYVKKTDTELRVLLNDLVGGRVSDPVLKGFLLSSIQAREKAPEKTTRTLEKVTVRKSVTVREKVAIEDNMEDSEKRVQKVIGRGGDINNGYTYFGGDETDNVSKTENKNGVGKSVSFLMTKIEASMKTLKKYEPNVNISNNLSKKIKNINHEEFYGFEWKFIIEGITGSKGALSEWPDSLRSTVIDENIDVGDKGTNALPLQFLEPVLIMKGGNSKFVKSSHLSKIAEHFPKYTMMTVREAGHWLHVEKPQESSSFLIQFIRNV
eukprot:CAMPEP_0119048582 /NCGR_PEP_ID=MMETSP1177-20130426/59633_1 /TAXON_ID=2985 /ORGANISM="Ochromonas sp, Strain CCMP1899" /LENGTH=662 /DNA_ID=CAMNT_0007024655 /DNA_START=245 /DNA_END=2230 /DNA_ORIENTATION=-